jgi:RNA-directed DNA polymerase
MENGVVILSEDGVPQGGPVSPVLSNIYLHYVLDLWFERRFKKTCRGYAELTRFADDYVAVFYNYEEAARFRGEMDERLAAFGLRIAPEKTAQLRRQPVARNGSAGEEAGDLHLPWLHPLPCADVQGTVLVGRTPSVKTRERSSPRSPSGYAQTGIKASGNTRRS